MRYPECHRILISIAKDKRSDSDMLMEVAHLLRSELPKLGPFKRESPEAIFHRIAGTYSLHPAKRLEALYKLFPDEGKNLPLPPEITARKAMVRVGNSLFVAGV